MEPNPKTKLNSIPGWRELLHLGEELLGFPSAVAQSKWLEKRLAKITGGVVKVWLLEPYYPLPGEPPGSVLKTSEMDETTQTVIQSKNINLHEHSYNPESDTYEITLPCITDGNVLAIARIELSKKIFDAVTIDFLEDLTSHAAISMQIHRQEAIKNWRSEQLSLVRKVSSEISNFIYSADLFHQIANLIKKTFKYYHVGIYTVNKQKNGIRLQASTFNSFHERHCKSA